MLSTLFKKNYLFTLFLTINILNSFQLKNLKQTHPPNLEITPVPYQKMLDFKKSISNYLDKKIKKKPIFKISPGCWTESHTILFRQYCISLENLIFEFIKTPQPEDQVLGLKIVNFIEKIEEATNRELNQSTLDIKTLEEEVKVLEKALALINSKLIEKLKLWISIKLDSIDKKEFSPEMIYSLEKEIDQLTSSKLSVLETIAENRVLKSYILKRGLPKTFFENEKNLLGKAANSDIENNLFCQQFIKAKIEDQTYILKTVTEIELNDQNYVANSKLAYKLCTEEAEAFLSQYKKSLEEKRIVLDTKILKGTYNPEDYLEDQAEEISPSQNVQEKYISFAAFKEAWDFFNFQVADKDELFTRKVSGEIISIKGKL